MDESVKLSTEEANKMNEAKAADAVATDTDDEGIALLMPDLKLTEELVKVKFRDIMVSNFNRLYIVRLYIMHPRPPGRHIGIDSQLLILSFELKFFVCRHVSMWGFQNRVCLSVRTPRKEITIALSISVLH